MSDTKISVNSRKIASVFLTSLLVLVMYSSLYQYTLVITAKAQPSDQPKEMTAKKVGTVTVNDLKKPPTLFPEFQVINGTYQYTEFTRLGVNKSEEVGALKESAALQKGPSEAITINPESIRKPLSINATMGNNTSSMPSNVESSNFASLNVTKAQSLTLPKSWDGLTMAKACSPGCTPPDGGLGAGPNHILQMVNVGGIIWTKNGTLVSQFALRDFFQTKMDRLSDPEVIYDNMSGRWFTSIFDITKESTQVSVSATDDPTGKWFVYQFPFVSCPDQPRIGTSDSLFVVSVNDFGSKCTDGFVGVQYAIVLKSDLINGVDSPVLQVTSPDPSQFSVVPAHSLSSTPTMYMVSVADFSSNNVQLINVSGTPPSAVITSTSIPIRQADIPPEGDQVDASKIDTGDMRLNSAVFRDGRIWLGFANACLPVNDTQVQSCIRLININTSSNSLIQDFDVAALDSDFYYPVLRTDGDGNLFASFGYSSSTVHPSLLIAKQSVSDANDTIQTPVFLVGGSAPDSTGRHGDYAAASIDPSNSSLIWVEGEYGKSGVPGWATFVASVNASQLEHTLLIKGK